MKKINIPLFQSRAAFSPGSLNEEDRTVELVASTGQKGKRWSWDIGDYYEELEISEDAMRMERFQSGAAPLLDGHDRSGKAENQIGVILSARVENGQLITLVKFASDERSENIWQKVKDGIVKSCSVGYKVYKYQDVSEDDDKIKTYRAIDFEPMELSTVTIPFEINAQVRNEGIDTNECEILVKPEQERREMNDKTKNAPVVNTPEVDTEAIRNDAANEATLAERSRVSEIRSSVESLKLGNEIADKLVNDGTSIEEARKMIIAEKSKKDAEVETRAANSVTIGQDEVDVRRDSIESALSHRLHGAELEKDARRYAGLTLLETARMCLGRDADGLSRRELAARALHHTSDLPHVMANVAHKTLRKAYESAPKTFKPIARETKHVDFKGVKRVTFEDNLSLEKLLEGGVIKHGTISDSSVDYSLVSYGKQISFTREMLINDDLDALDRIVSMFGMNAGDLESEIFWEKFIASSNFTSANTGTGGAISETTLNELDLKYAAYKKANGKPMVITPEFLIVSATNKIAALKQLTAINAAETSKVNVYDNSYKLIVERRLQGTPWYMSTGKNFGAMEVAYLLGQEGVSIEKGVDFDTRGIKISAVHDFAAACIDPKGLAKNAGA